MALLFGIIGAGNLYATVNDSVQVRTIVISGAKKTKRTVVVRELTFREKDQLPVKSLSDILERNRQNVFNLGLFSAVEVEPFIVGLELHIVIHVKERWYIFPIPKVKAEERNSYDLIRSFSQGDFHRVSYGLDLQWYNVTGRNETLTFFGQLGFSKRLRFRYSHPGIFGMQYTDLAFGASFINKNEIITRTEGSQALWDRLESTPLETSQSVFLQVKHRFSIYKNLVVSLDHSWKNFEDSLNVFNQQYLPGDELRTSYPAIVLAYSHDTRDWHSFPLKGRRYRLLFRHAGIPGVSTHQFSKIGFTWAEHIPLSKRWNVSYGLQNVLTLGKEIPYFEKSSIGLGGKDLPGISTELRGYERYAIDGSWVGMAKGELKFALVPYQTINLKMIPIKMFQQMPFGAYLSSYADFGYVEDRTTSNFDNTLKGQGLFGYGLGINFIGFYDMMLRIEYSRNHLGEDGIYFHSSLPIR
ncbi:MAG: BamA/TamA family outer membrane protein [Bacteroidota bacterium]